MLLFLFLFSSAHAAQEIWLKVGEVRQFEAPTGKAIRVGTRGVIKVIDGESSVRVVGLKPGNSPLLIGDRNFTVRVSLGQQQDFIKVLREQLSHMMGLRLESESKPMAVVGTLLRFSDWQRISELARQYQGEYVFKAQALPDVAEKAVTFLQQLARQKGLPVVRFRADPEFTAQVPQAAGHLRENAAALFKSYGIQVESTDSELMLQPLVRTRVILAELARNNERELGIKWPTENEAQLLPRFKTEDSLLVTLKALESRGQAQILASPNLICRSGSEATFHAGGEFPVKMFSRFTHDILWKQHGVMLAVKPEADFQGAISLGIETEVSLLDMANSVEGIPALKSNKVKSHFDLPGKRTIALSGLLRQEIGELKEGLPYLTGIPILGALFSSQKFRKNQTELVIFVTPEIYVPEDEKVVLPEGWVREGA